MLWSEFERLGRFIDPWREFERMSRDLSRMGSQNDRDFPHVNAWTSADKAVVTTEVPGMNREDIDISVADEVLTIKGKRHSDDPKAEETYHRRERWTGQFSKNIVLPFRVENSRVEAKYQKGVLTIVLPREAVAEQREERTRERRVYTPAVDIIEGKDETTVIADMPGVDESSVDITLEKNILEIYGKVDPDIPQGMRLVISEYGIGDYHRRFTLSDEIDRDRIQATVKNGVLRLILPRAEKAKTRKIEVRAGQ